MKRLALLILALALLAAPGFGQGAGGTGNVIRLLGATTPPPPAGMKVLKDAVQKVIVGSNGKVITVR